MRRHQSIWHCIPLGVLAGLILLAAKLLPGASIITIRRLISQVNRLTAYLHEQKPKSAEKLEERSGSGLR